jgi:hypothetical protein
MKSIPVGIGLLWCAMAAAVAVVGMLCVAPAHAASPAPAWKLTATAAPTNFPAGDIGTGEAGPAYLIEATNVGGAATGDGVTLQAILPLGVHPSNAEGRADDPGLPAPDCSISGQVVICSISGPVQPSRSVGMVVVVDTEAGLSGPVLAEVEISGGGASPAAATAQTVVGLGPPAFGFLPGPDGLASSLTQPDGSTAALAGSHPHQLTFDVGFPSTKAVTRLINSGHPRDLSIGLPRGFVVNPAATAVRCDEGQLAASNCPPTSQVGIATFATSVIGLEFNSAPLYNMVPPPGSASNFAFDAGKLGVLIHLLGSVRTGDYGLTAEVQDLLARFPILGMRLQLWGDPSDPSHDDARGVSVPPQPQALLTMPSACGPFTTSGAVDSWDEPGVLVRRSVENRDLDGDPVEVSGCGALGFSPSLEARPTTSRSDSPSGLEVGLGIPQAKGPLAAAVANLKRAVVALPEGLVPNPSGANGLEGCSSAQIGLITPVGATPAGFDAGRVGCPGAARIGAAEVDTPLLGQPLHGSVFLATPHDNPFGSLLALYVAVDDADSGVVIKLAGRVDADPRTGRLTVTFDELPELPIASVELRFFGGATAPLRTPAVCGAYSTTSSLTPWSAPESGPPATPADRYPIDRSPSGACATSEGALPNSPTLDAGVVSPTAGASTPFVLDLRRDDGAQQLSALTLSLPPGLVGKLAGTPSCPEAALAAAATKTGAASGRGAPICPVASRLGSATIGAGAGAAPYFAHGNAYLAGPYEGASLSLAIVVPALAGPFDLGTVVVRSALHVDPRTARITAVSDPIPTILQGIPLDVRSVQVTLDKPGFIHNPTSCDPLAVGAVATSSPGPSVPLVSRFQMGGCQRLGFRPGLSVRLIGPTHRGAHPKLRTVLRPRRGDANIRRLAVTLPATELLDNRRIQAICGRRQFAAEHCPPGSIYGRAKVWTPLLEQPLEGPVYLRASDTRLPVLAASLGGQVDLDLVGRIDSVHGRLRNTFQALPDAPLSKVVLTTYGGRRGFLANTGGLCAKERRVSASVTAQSGKIYGARPVERTACGK